MRTGIAILPEHDWPEARARWTAAEQLGFWHGWTFDHLMWRWLRAEPWFGTMPTLSAVAAVTTTLRIGTLVASPNFRHPVTFAKEVMTLDNIAGGRFICGLGAGGEGFDNQVLGGAPLPATERMDRFEEFVELTDRLLTNAETTHHGAYYHAYEAHMNPGCVQRPRVPFAIAAGGPRGMRLAARHAQIWVTVGRPGSFESSHYTTMIPVLAEQVARFEDACAEVGTDPAGVRRLVVAGSQVGGVLDSAESFRDAVGLLSGVGMTDLVVFWPRPDFPFAGKEEVLEQLAGDLR